MDYTVPFCSKCDRDPCPIDPLNHSMPERVSKDGTRRGSVWGFDPTGALVAWDDGTFTWEVWSALTFRNISE